jgi:hypothetical protein
MIFAAGLRESMLYMRHGWPWVQCGDSHAVLIQIDPIILFYNQWYSGIMPYDLLSTLFNARLINVIDGAQSATQYENAWRSVTAMRWIAESRLQSWRIAGVGLFC